MDVFWEEAGRKGDERDAEGRGMGGGSEADVRVKRRMGERARCRGGERSRSEV